MVGKLITRSPNGGQPWGRRKTEKQEARFKKSGLRFTSIQDNHHPLHLELDMDLYIPYSFFQAFLHIPVLKF